jgi:hypothetical protein
MEFWTIRHKPSMTFMPARPGGRKARGWSHWTPRVQHPLYSKPPGAPRLFESERAAKNALTCWLQGEWHVQYGSVSWEEGGGTEEIGCAPEDPEQPRHRDEMEVVQVRLEVRA